MLLIGEPTSAVTLTEKVFGAEPHPAQSAIQI
jgi:hypothetical protein